MGAFYVRQCQDMNCRLSLKAWSRNNEAVYKTKRLGLGPGRRLLRRFSCNRRLPSNSDVLDDAIVRFTPAYADQTENDYQAMRPALRKGRLKSDQQVTLEPIA